MYLALHVTLCLALIINSCSVPIIIESFFTTSTGDGTTTLHGRPSHSSCLQGKGSTFISQLFQDLSIGPVPGIKSMTSHSAVKHYAVPTKLILLQLTFMKGFSILAVAPVFPLLVCKLTLKSNPS